MPAYKPRYALAAPRIIARIAPTNTAFIVSSGIIFDAGINDLKSSRDDMEYYQYE
jgi:hypothetical protein